jgi:hypothetical protein
MFLNSSFESSCKSSIYRCFQKTSIQAYLKAFPQLSLKLQSQSIKASPCCQQQTTQIMFSRTSTRLSPVFFAFSLRLLVFQLSDLKCQANLKGVPQQKTFFSSFSSSVSQDFKVSRKKASLFKGLLCSFSSQFKIKCLLFLFKITRKRNFIYFPS